MNGEPVLIEQERVVDVSEPTSQFYFEGKPVGEMLRTQVREFDRFRNFKFFCELAWSFCNNQDDFIFMINGKRGTGKSTFGVCFLKYYLTRFLKVPFNKKVLRQCMVCDAELLADRIHNLPAKYPIILDEAVVAAYVGDFAKRDVKELTKLFTICRTKNRAVGIVTPEFFDVVTRLRNYSVYRVRCICRGVSVLYTRDDGEGNAGDMYHLKDLKDIEGVYDRTSLPAEIIGRLKRHPCFKDVIKFPKLDEHTQEWYDEYRNEMTFDNDKEKLLGNEAVVNVFYNLLANFEKLKGLNKVTQKFFVEKLCVTPSGTAFFTIPVFNRMYKAFFEKTTGKKAMVDDDAKV